ncbi:MAG TPA: FkbM family methyltransferase [Gammaproteobacteria bacterium]|nr:FkbM family methyltransferase [Xanthomonadales bacterium]MCB1595289.1 FkbM family methyltransferase [Xanthomonadales bacterium]HOP21315.1 FkbM family methyltransferase [Gammaproteobacteria bacterium]HPI94883.1 FkbM family methyltransferase [Gammaproteobacteria bacterium]HPQ86476.1 FkbM family methyltransferase [Gammaproteobacteria bacterium]
MNTQNIHTYNIIDNGVIEKPICKIMEDNIKEGDVFIDVGANIGFLTLLGCHLTGTSGHVYSFEANPEVFKLLEENIIINSLRNNTSLFNKAAYHKKGKVKFTWNTHRDGSGRIVTKVQSGLAQHHCEVDTTTLDSVFSGMRVDFVKIDTEGSEPHVLEGMKNIIQANNEIKIIFEWNTKHIRKRDASPEKAAEFLFSNFKHINRIVKVDELQTLTKETLLSLPHSNIYAYN